MGHMTHLLGCNKNAVYGFMISYRLTIHDYVTHGAFALGLSSAIAFYLHPWLSLLVGGSIYRGTSGSVRTRTANSLPGLDAEHYTQSLASHETGSGCPSNLAGIRSTHHFHGKKTPPKTSYSSFGSPNSDGC